MPERMIEAGQANPAQNQAGTNPCVGAAGGGGGGGTAAPDWIGAKDNAATSAVATIRFRLMAAPRAVRPQRRLKT
jgi:hypothetical protein